MQYYRILVHLHIYYHDQVAPLMEKLGNIDGCSWDLVVTASSKVEETEKLIHAKKSDAKILYLENRGYDVWPFIYVLKNTRISDYDLVLKVHTKNVMNYRVRINGRLFYDSVWRDLLVNTVLDSREQFLKLLSMFEDSEVGLVCNCSLLRGPKNFIPWKKGLLQKEMRRVGIPCLGVKKMHYCAGTMFLARMKPYELVANADLSPEMFEVKQATRSCNTLSYYYEQIFGYVQEACGYKIKTVSDRWYYRYIKFVHDIVDQLGIIFSLDRNNEFEYKYLTLFGMRFKLDDAPKSDK